MGSTCARISSIFSSYWRAVFITVASVGIITCIIYGSISASNYVKTKNTWQLYTSTNCLLLNYSLADHQCQSCSSYGYCSYYECFDEVFTVSYPISNGTSIRSVFSSMNNPAQHFQTQV